MSEKPIRLIHMPGPDPLCRTCHGTGYLPAQPGVNADPPVMCQCLKTAYIKAFPTCHPIDPGQKPTGKQEADIVKVARQYMGIFGKGYKGASIMESLCVEIEKLREDKKVIMKCAGCGEGDSVFCVKYCQMKKPTGG